MNINRGILPKIPIRLNLFVILTLVVFLTPLVMQLTGNNYVKLLEDATYMLLLLYSVQMMLNQGRIKVRISKTGLVLTILLTLFAVIGIYYNGLSLVVLQFREFKYLLIPIILIPYRDINYFKPVWTTLKLIAATSVPVSIVQWFIYRSEGDRITGILGYGASGTLTLFLLILFFSELGDRLQKNKNVLGSYFIYLIPTALNETKITFILFPFLLITMLFITKKLKSVKSFVLLLGVIGLLLGWAYFYEKTYANSILDFFLSDQMNDYLYSTQWEGDAGRFAKITYAYEIIKNENILFGYGLGASYYGASSGLQGFILRNHYSAEMFGGTRPQLFLSLIDFGLVGSVLIVLIIIFYFVNTLRSMGESIERMVVINTIVILLATLAYQNIFYTYQIMYILILFLNTHLKSSHRKKEVILNE